MAKKKNVKKKNGVSKVRVLKEKRRLYTTSIVQLYKSLDQAYRVWEKAYNRFKKYNDRFDYTEARRAGNWYIKRGGRRKVIIPTRYVLDIDTSKPSFIRNRRTGKLEKREPNKKRGTKKSKKRSKK